MLSPVPLHFHAPALPGAPVPSRPGCWSCPCPLLLVGLRQGSLRLPPPPAALPATVLEVSTREVPVLIEAVGRTEGSKEVEVRARVSGILEKINYAEGTPVKAGTPLYRIDPALFEIALAEAKAALAAGAGAPRTGRPRKTIA